jgi:hypothetical protein
MDSVLKRLLEALVYPRCGSAYDRPTDEKRDMILVAYGNTRQAIKS